MIPWEFIDSAHVPGNGGELSLHKRGAEFQIRVDGQELMNSRSHGSEEALAELELLSSSGEPELELDLMRAGLLADLGRDAPALTVVDLDLGRVAAARRQIPALMTGRDVPLRRV